MADASVRPAALEPSISTRRERRRSAALALSPAQTARVCRAVRDLRASHGSQERVAKALGVSQQTISSAIIGRRASPALAAAVARNLGISFEELLGPVE